MDALTTTDADAITLSGLSYFCAAAAADVEMATALSWVEMAAVKQSGSSCFCAAVADTVETTMETAVAASKSKSNLTTHLGTTKTGGYDASGSYSSQILFSATPSPSAVPVLPFSAGSLHLSHIHFYHHKLIFPYAISSIIRQ